MVGILGLCLSIVAEAVDSQSLVRDLPRVYVGEFQWSAGSAIQRVRFEFPLLRRIDDSQAEAIGCGIYDTSGRVTTIRVRMLVVLPAMEIEIWELDPVGDNARAFNTDGSHRGRLSEDLRTIDAEWTTRSTGQKGTLQLRSATGVVCSPPQISGLYRRT